MAVLHDTGRRAGSDTWPSPDAMARWRRRGGRGATIDLNLCFMARESESCVLGADRIGDNLYTSSLVALDADSGKLRWHYQFTPHDLHDWDAAQVPVLATLPVNGRDARVVLQANRNGLFYVLDRATGKVLRARPFVKAAWATGVDANGRPVVPNDLGTPDACIPDHRGATNFPPPSYDPARRLFFVTARETCATYNPGPPRSRRPDKDHDDDGTRPAARVWRDSYLSSERSTCVRGRQVGVAYRPLPSTQMAAFGGGVLSTASGLVFAADDEGNFRAVSSDDGRVLWQAQLGASPAGAAPMTYMFEGRQWVVIAAGSALHAFALPPKETRPSAQAAGWRSSAIELLQFERVTGFVKLR